MHSIPASFLVVVGSNLTLKIMYLEEVFYFSCHLKLQLSGFSAQMPGFLDWWGFFLGGVVHVILFSQLLRQNVISVSFLIFPDSSVTVILPFDIL
jgi:hypothetical protein